jgi:hypothetical protein
MLKNPADYDRDISSTKFTAISRQVFPDSLLIVSAGIYLRAWWLNQKLLEHRWGRTMDKNGRSVWDALYDTTL